MEKRSPRQKKMWILRTIIICVVLAIFAHAAITRFNQKYMIGVQSLTSRCLPWDFYVIEKRPPAKLEHGQLVMFPLPRQAIDLCPKVQRLKNKGFLIKMVAGLPGDRIKIADDELYINGHAWSYLWLIYKLRRPKGFFDQELTVKEGEVFVLGTLGDSYDSRYWGPIKQNILEGTAHVLF